MVILPKLSAQRLSTRVAITGLIAAIIVASVDSKREGSNGYDVARKQYPERACRESPTNNVCSVGIYRGASPTSLKDGDSFIGRPGATMDGAKQLSGWATASIRGAHYWTAAGGSGARAACCLPRVPGMRVRAKSLVDNVGYRHVISLAQGVVRSRLFATGLVGLPNWGRFSRFAENDGR